ncbi:hypothetical protein JCM6882_008139 [Rhodosporidiobolus microsporus]
MLGLKSKTLSLPHLSLSRNSSPARQGGSRDSTPVHSPLSSAPSTGSFGTSGERDATPPTSTSTSPRLSAKRNKSNSPKLRPLDAPPVDTAAAAAAVKEAKENKAGAAFSRRSSFGASLAAFTSSASSRSSSPSSGTTALPSGAPKSPSVPAGLTITPATSAHGTTSGRSTSDDRSGLRPLRSLSGRGKARSKSSDRAHDAVEPITAAAAQPAPKEKKGGGMMGPLRRGLALGHSQSQPGAARSSSVPPLAHGHGSPALPASGAGSPVLAGSGAATPAQAYAAANGGALPPASVAATPSGAGGPSVTGVQLHQLAESYVGKVSLRLGEAVNKVFLPIPNGPGGISNKEMERAEAPYGGSGAAWKGRPAPRVLRSREVGEMIAAELQAALHDVYLLRTLLRSSVLKALSLFLTRLSALLLAPSPSDPSLAPSLFAPPTTLKEADSLPLPLRFNLQIVRCAYEVKRALSVVADPAAGFPSFVEDTLRPWRIKLGELMGRVMSPLVGSARLAVADICERARLEGVPPAFACAVEGGSSALGLNGLHPPSAVKQTATSQLRSLSLGRATPSPSASGASTPVPSSSAAATAHGGAAGPLWLRDLAAHLDAFARLVARLECRADADKWLVSVATATVWKGMLNCSARVIGAVGAPPLAAAGAALDSEKRPPTPTTGKKGFLGGVTAKKTPSPPGSPPLPGVDPLASGAATAASSATARLAHAPATAPSTSDVAFVRLISDLELLEARLQAFLSASLSSASTVLAPAAPPSSACPGGATCGLCRTGRAFDPESEDSDSEDDDEPHAHGQAHGKRADPGRESRLALSAMREAMQALSALVVVVRASKDVGVIREALETRPPMEEEKQEKQEKDAALPMTPSALFALGSAPAPAPASTTTAAANASTTTITLLPPSSSLSPACPTLHSALLELPPLILLHLIASRLPFSLSSSSSTPFRLPHTLWSLRGGWTEYASELRGFAAGEEWAPEVAWEIGGEVERLVAEREMGGVGWARGEREACDALRVAVRRAGGGGAVAGRD